jgi:hypothetical protein
MPGGNQKARWSPPKETGYDLLMLPDPGLVNRDEETYILQGPLNLKTRVTKENWSTLRFNTKSMSPEYFPSSYLSPVPTAILENEDVSKATFPRSTITGTLEDFRSLLLVPLLSENNRVCQDVYRTLSLNIASGANLLMDKATAPKRIGAFLRLCELYISCEFDEYKESVIYLDSEVGSDLRTAKFVLEVIQEQKLPMCHRQKLTRNKFSFKY